jgi:hypothetical protein
MAKKNETKSSGTRKDQNSKNKKAIHRKAEAAEVADLEDVALKADSEDVVLIEVVAALIEAAAA